MQQVHYLNRFEKKATVLIVFLEYEMISPEIGAQDIGLKTPGVNFSGVIAINIFAF